MCSFVKSHAPRQLVGIGYGATHNFLFLSFFSYFFNISSQRASTASALRRLASTRAAWAPPGPPRRARTSCKTRRSRASTTSACTCGPTTVRRINACCDTRVGPDAFHVTIFISPGNAKSPAFVKQFITDHVADVAAHVPGKPFGAPLPADVLTCTDVFTSFVPRNSAGRVRQDRGPKAPDGPHGAQRVHDQRVPGGGGERVLGRAAGRKVRISLYILFLLFVKQNHDASRILVPACSGTCTTRGWGPGSTGCM